LPSIIDVAKYIIHKSGHIFPLRIEFLCYYAQGWILAWHEVPIFDEDFYAWPRGPICPALHEAFSDFDYHSGYWDEYDDNALNELQKRCIDVVLDTYDDFLPMAFMKMPKNEEPWLIANESSTKDDSYALITKEDMLDYYAGRLVPDHMKTVHTFESGYFPKHLRPAPGQILVCSNYMDDEKALLIEERNKLIEERDKLIEKKNKLIEKKNKQNNRVPLWKRRRAK
jgi:uncharacterized phage-associated protein